MFPLSFKIDPYINFYSYLKFVKLWPIHKMNVLSLHCSINTKIIDSTLASDNDRKIIKGHEKGWPSKKSG